MCFAIPKKIISVNRDTAVIEGGISVFLNTLRDVSEGDYILVYANTAIERIKKNDAVKIRKLIQRIENHGLNKTESVV